MSNLISLKLNGQTAVPSAKTEVKPEFTFDTEGKIKPLDDKGKLLPSRIISSPFTAINDLSKDVVNIGKAAKGEANDHELGKINDVAMKVGALALAGYLFVKNPLKLSKAMEFAGVGTFFAGMALWPKLAIQAPLKIRTGVDIHQKYTDSQGRKKMLFQDPQYVLTDLYSKEDLEKVGKKLKVSKNLPDRDNYIKQRAQKIALQGNTLWMMTAGIATPVMSALGCNVLEKPIGKIIEKADLKSTEKALAVPEMYDSVTRARENFAQRNFERFFDKNAERVMDKDFVSELSEMITKDVNSAELQNVIKEELASLRVKPEINEEFIKNALKGHVEESVFEALTDVQRSALDDAIKNQKLTEISDILSKAVSSKKPQQKKLATQYGKLLKSASEKHSLPKLSDFEEEIKDLYVTIYDFSSKKKVLDKYIDARIGNKSGSYIANQWGRFTSKTANALTGKFNLSEKEIRALASGDIGLLNKKLANLAGSENYDAVMTDLMKLIGEYDEVTGEKFIDRIIEKTGADSQRLEEIANKAAEKASEAAETSNEVLQKAANAAAAKRAKGGANAEAEAQKAMKEAIAEGKAKAFKNAFDATVRSVDSESTLFKDTGKQLEKSNFLKAAEKINPSNASIATGQDIINSKKGTLANEAVTSARERVTGAKSSFYRVIQALDLHKRIQDGSLAEEVKSALQKQGKSVEDREVKNIIEKCQKVILSATTTDYVEKLKTQNFNLSKDEYKIVMELLFGKNSGSTVGEALKNKMDAEEAGKMVKGFQEYKERFMSVIANWQNGMTPELSRCTVDGVTNGANALERNDVAGKSLKSLFEDLYSQRLKSNKWLKIFGGIMIGLTVATVAATLTFGRKSDTEKQAEAENK